MHLPHSRFNEEKSEEGSVYTAWRTTCTPQSDGKKNKKTRQDSVSLQGACSILWWRREPASSSSSFTWSAYIKKATLATCSSSRSWVATVTCCFISSPLKYRNKTKKWTSNFLIHSVGFQVPNSFNSSSAVYTFFCIFNSVTSNHILAGKWTLVAKSFLVVPNVRPQSIKSLNQQADSKPAKPEGEFHRSGQSPNCKHKSNFLPTHTVGGELLFHSFHLVVVQ